MARIAGVNIPQNKLVRIGLTYIFGIGEKNEKKLGKGVYKHFGKGKEGFNITSCQFALHYFFENVGILNNFLQNVSDCTKVGGYFIGCCYDGDKLFKDLSRTAT